MNTLALVKVAKLVHGNKTIVLKCPQLTGFEKESVARDIAAQVAIKSHGPLLNWPWDFDTIRTMIRFDWEPQANMLLN